MKLDNTSYLLVCAMEECAEVQQSISKTLRFGLEDFYKEAPTNQERIALEWIDLIAIMEELISAGVLILPNNADELIQRKKGKIAQFMEYSKERGMLE